MTGAGERARRVADEVLLPDAAAVDRADRVPAAHLAALDGAGLTGLAAAEPDLATRIDVAAALAGGCLATAFVWLQHQGALANVLRGPAGLRERYAAPLTDGRLRAAIAITALRPPAPLRILPNGAGWRLTGRAPWVTGWGSAGVVLVAALDPDGVVRLVLVDADASASLAAEPLDLVAARASRTVTLRFDGLRVAADRLVASVPLDEWTARDAAGLAGNGALALGVAERAARLAEDDRLLAEVTLVRTRLLEADVDALPDARGACSALALRAAAVLTVLRGSSSVLAGSDAERLLREAQFLLVFGSRPAIRDALLPRLAG
ncbi:acyl-CoA/acyl-ACP dehydrogenase [Amnibacterium sp. CER49]|uniref:acyl-CoA/acyl-ACP dehydrogenase n=1 Tax=Amnibacterium sp. CER49 TaxID=3039161 RepID=UPI002449580C|nr:acyl-CoA/acyl-ACP dehydrogenase [Amnibacterium sp. CER49]MDH2442765.1 acyl-CoA/acyl-ACP dehydrogenase [Amnibacterium sp. CER49]